jgi:hypothetical protein
MDNDIEAREYRQFQVDLLNSKFKGAHTEKEMIERLILLCQKRNRHALRGIAEAKLCYAPDSRMSNSIWEKGAIYSLTDIAEPTQTGPAGTDNFGLWRSDGGKRK